MKFLAALTLAAAGLTGAAQAASITIHKQPNFTGGHVTLNDTTPNLTQHGIQDQASSLVLDGRWEVCTQPNFAGDCRVLEPGRYATLDGSLNHRIESARPVGRKDVVVGSRGDNYGRDDRGREGRWGGRERGAIDIFPGADFRGRPMRVERDTESLERFSDQASSVIVHEGTWQLCTQAAYEGRCRTFEPGRYASLGGRLDNNVASVKQIR
jgi:hypothetical protein